MVLPSECPGPEGKQKVQDGLLLICRSSSTFIAGLPRLITGATANSFLGRCISYVPKPSYFLHCLWQGVVAQLSNTLKVKHTLLLGT
jgi:hypothetical protein